LTSDIAIVGAGITGLSVAFHLAEREAGSIIVYEREGIGAGASGVQPGGVRQQWSTRLNCVMARDFVAEDRWLFFSDPIAERLLDPLVIAVDRRFAAKQLADGRMLASDLSATGDAAEGSELWRRRIRQVSVDLFPRLEFVVFPLLVRGVYDVTPDRQAHEIVHFRPLARRPRWARPG
jgi:glycine/D-amino acid oxidase-like deaminating enzyme